MATLIPVVAAKDRRHLHNSDTGADVLAYGRLVARTLTHMGLITTNARNGVFGEFLLRDTLLLQHALGLAPTGIVDLALWEAVDPQMHAYERWLLRLPTPKPATNRSKIAAQMRVMLIIGLVFYSQRRPAARSLLAWRRIGGDCSGSALLARCIVLGIAYDGYGNTGTIWSQGIPITEAEAEEGDYIIYGSNGVTHHVAVISNLARRLAIGFGAAPGRESDWRYRGDLMGFRRMA